MTIRIAVSWSSGKDSAWMLHSLRQRREFEIVSLVTTFQEETNRVAMHGVRRELVEAQARAAGLPLWSVTLPWPCSNAEYERRMETVWEECRRYDVTHVAFGDLFLEEIRDYRARQLAATGLTPLFPIWCGPEGTPELARQMIAAGLRTIVTCVDSRQLSASFLGREFDDDFLRDLPPTADPCGENGEFHTFCYAGPSFARPVAIAPGERVERDGFPFVDLTSAESTAEFLTSPSGTSAPG